MGELDFLDEFSGPKPRRRGFAISVSPEAMALIGHLTLQWGALIEGIQFLKNSSLASQKFPLK